jgi:hypothetical protein
MSMDYQIPSMDHISMIKLFHAYILYLDPHIHLTLELGIHI